MSNMLNQCIDTGAWWRAQDVGVLHVRPHAEADQDAVGDPVVPGARPVSGSQVQVRAASFEDACWPDMVCLWYHQQRLASVCTRLGCLCLKLPLNPYRVPTLGEVLELVRKANADGKDVGVFVQVQPWHSSGHRTAQELHGCMHARLLAACTARCERAICTARHQGLPC